MHNSRIGFVAFGERIGVLKLEGSELVCVKEFFLLFGVGVDHNSDEKIEDDDRANSHLYEEVCDEVLVGRPLRL